MNDRFPGQLRQHLLNTANERPADGQVAAVVDVVAVTRQRPLLAARLTWLPGRIGPFPSATLRYGLVALALVATTVGAAILGGGSSPSGTVFEGTWTSTDPGDDSRQTLVVGAGRTPVVRFEDAYATGDACLADAVKVFTADGTGEISGSRLDVAFPDGGGCGLMTVAMHGVYYDFDAATGTLLDHEGLDWTRVGGGEPPATERPATQRPATQQPATEPPNSESPATEPPATPRPSPRAGEATFTSTIHGISIDYPSGWQARPATEPWTGGR